MQVKGQTKRATRTHFRPDLFPNFISAMRLIAHQSIPILVNKYDDSLKAALGELPGGVGSTLEKCLQLGGRHPLVGVRPSGLRLFSLARWKLQRSFGILMLLFAFSLALFLVLASEMFEPVLQPRAPWGVMATT